LHNRIKVFNDALNLAQKKQEEHPSFFILKSIIDQLLYLIRIEEGKEKDFSDLMNMTLGRITARDIENWDKPLASILHSVSAEIPFMQKQYLGK
jgi:hypothetical protein